MGLKYITYAPPMQKHLGMMMALAKRWHSETSSFHLLTGEAIVTLEDVCRILRFPIHSEWLIYDMNARREACYAIMGTDEFIFYEG